MGNAVDRLCRVAVLIDADNVAPSAVGAVFEEAAKIGKASVRRIYGDFSGTRLKGWADVLSTHAIVPHQNFATTTGKNATDIALVIDAMDLLHSGRLDAFCIVSSDGDFTRLAARIREQGPDVYGFGERKAPEGFRQACKRFIFIDDAVSKPAETIAIASTSPAPKQSPSDAVPHLQAAIDQSQGVDGWHFLGTVGQRLLTVQPGFDPKAYGCAKLASLVEQSQAFEVRRENLQVFVRPRN